MKKNWKGVLWRQSFWVCIQPVLASLSTRMILTSWLIGIWVATVFLFGRIYMLFYDSSGFFFSFAILVVFGGFGLFCGFGF